MNFFRIKKISVKFILVILFIFLVVFGIIFFADRAIREIIINSQGQHLSVIRDMKVKQIDAWYQEVVRNMNKLSRNIAFILTDPVQSEKDIPNIFVNNMKIQPGTSEIFYIDIKTGAIKFSTNDNNIGKNMSNEDFYQIIIKEPKLYVKKIQSNKNTRKQEMLLAHPVFSKKNPDALLTGIVVTVLDYEETLVEIINNRTGLEQTGEVLVIDPQKNIINKQINYKKIGLDSTINFAINGATGIIKTVDSEKNNILVSFTYLPVNQWGFLVIQDIDEILAPYTRISKVLFYSIVIIVFFTVLVFVGMANQIIKPIYNLLNATKHVSTGNFDHRINSRRIDEIGQLSNEFDKMVENLQRITGSRDELNKEINQRTLIEEKLRNSQSFLKETQAIGKVGSWKNDLVNKETIWTEEIYNLIGLPAIDHRITFEWFFEFIHPDDKEKYLNWITENMQSENITMNDLEFRIINTDGITKHCLARGRFTLSPDGTILAAQGTIQDITELKEKEFQLVKLTQELTQINSAKDRLFSLIGHDLRGKIGGLNSFISLIITNFEDYSSEKIFKQLNILKEYSEESYNLLDNLMEWGRMQMGRKVFNPVKFDLQQLVSEEIKRVELFASQKEVFILSLINTSLFVKADIKMIQTILRNLLSNAIKFSNKNGVVQINADFFNEYLKISVSDTGTGMTKTEIENLFKNETHFSKKGTYNEKGAGLGLLLCKDFIDLHKGKLIIKSEPNIGSEFIVLLPQNTI